MDRFGNFRKSVYRVITEFYYKILSIKSNLTKTAQLINRNCPDRLYVFEKISQHKMVDEKAKEVEVADKTECENKCLTERFITCRSASYHQSSNKCYLSEFNRHVMPSQFKQDPEFEYLENMCLKCMFQQVSGY